MRFPVKLVAEMERVYRKELIKNCPQAANNALFYQALVEAGARWHIFYVLERLLAALKSDRPRGPTTLRQQLLAWLEAVTTLAEEYGGISSC